MVYAAECEGWDVDLSYFRLVSNIMTCDCASQMRHLYVVIDTSRTMEDQDLKPNRLTSTLKVFSSPPPSR